MSEPPATHVLLRQFLGDRDVPCPRCGYNLRGLAATTCPECAGAIELALRGEVPLGRYRRLVFVASGFGAIGFGLFGVISLVWFLRYGAFGSAAGSWRYAVSSAVFPITELTVAVILVRAFLVLRRARRTPGLAGDVIGRALAACAVVVVIYAGCFVASALLRLLLF